ncbi:HesB/YadR/YfhF family protein [Ectobacillus sp. JY-23]|uniref:HesB/YadR/YfhF family protein n=1 Tax=Ectobacillus sp. JY-23 TaxID=2933872 RepID=UPI001FF5E35C|nr:HesB/YadR/YfhF family protein [Ectobacillus sp. JY-23]UOY93225.1 HesB/YadR/YfhF family protein [Ectobacillus sp. JY-23]
MHISISNDAANWYKREMLLNEGDQIRFFVQYGGCSTVQKGLSLGIRKDLPQHMAASTQAEGLTFFVEADDEWYFDGHNLSITYTQGEEEPTFHYEK